MIADTQKVIAHLQEVVHLDALHGFMSNEVSDAMSPELGQWMQIVLREERQRRAGGEFDEYTLTDFEQWPTTALVGASMFTIGATETACQMENQSPTLNAFLFSLNKTIVATLGARLMTWENQSRGK